MEPLETSLQPSKSKKEEQFTVPPCVSLSMKGYDFVGWNTRKDGSGGLYKEAQSIEVYSDITLYAQWSIHTYSILYYLNDGCLPDGKSNPVGYTIETATLLLNNPERDGYEFLGWKTPESNEPNKNVSIFNGTTGDLSFTAVWKHLDSYSISYDVNGGEGSIGTALKCEGESAEIASVSGISRNGYEFVCWNTASDGTGKDYNPYDFYEENADLQLYAKWRIINYSMEYNLNGGELPTGKGNLSEYTVETSDIVLENPTRCGYEFVGWKFWDDSDVSASTNFSIKKGTTGNLSIVAVWKALDSYTVSYDANGGTETSETQHKYKGESLTISSGEDLERTGYTFVCWNTEKNGMGIDYNPNDSYRADADLRLYAKWNPVKYSIQYDLNGGTIQNDANPKEYTIETDTFTLLNPDEREGYRFLGWKESGYADESVSENISIEKGSTENKFFIAMWKQLNKCTITFDANGADESCIPTPLTVYEGDSFSVPPSSSLCRDYYVFIGWNTVSDGSGITYRESERFCADRDIVLYAIWDYSPLEYTYLEESDSYSVKCNDKKIVTFEIPATYKGKKVTCVEVKAFSNCSRLTSITLPSDVSCIGDSAFYGCYNLKDVTIPESVTSIGNSAFSGCRSLISITMPKNVTHIGDSAFYNCDNLKDITIPESVKSLGNSVFSGCLSLTSVTIPSSVTSITDSAFSGCCSLTSVTMPSSVTSIMNSAFYGCNSLRDITIPSSVTNIGSYAFYGCKGITKITIPKNVTSIGPNAFDGCSDLTLVFASGTTKTPDGALYYASGVVSVLISSSVTSIGNSAFSGCRNLTKLTIPEGVESIGCYAFSMCSSLKSIKMPSSLKRIGDYSFQGCSNLTVEFSEGTTRILDKALAYASGVVSVVIPSSVKSIGDSAFLECSGLKEISIPLNVTSIGERAFGYCNGLTNVMIPSNVMTIGASAFWGCLGLTAISLPSSVTNIGNYVFSYCNSLSSIVYAGTCSQWNSIEKESLWDIDTLEYTIHCADGDIAKD